MNRLICILGMCGAGKSEVADYMMKKRTFGFVRFGQIILDKVAEISDKPNEAIEKQVREDVRKEHGMAAMAILNMPKFDKLLEQGDVIGDGLYSWEEYLVLKEKYQDRLTTLAVYAPPALRYGRISDRADKHGEDKNNRFRNFSPEEAASRDKAEIENLHKAGPIAMADYTIINDGTIAELHQEIDRILEEVYAQDFEREERARRKSQGYYRTEQYRESRANEQSATQN